MSGRTRSPGKNAFSMSQFQWQPFINRTNDSQSHEPLESNADRFPILLLNAVDGAVTTFISVDITAVAIVTVEKLVGLLRDVVGVAVVTIEKRVGKVVDVVGGSIVTIGVVATLKLAFDIVGVSIVTIAQVTVFAVSASVTAIASVVVQFAVVTLNLLQRLSLKIGIGMR